MPSNTAQNQTGVTSSNNSFVGGQTLPHGAPGSGPQNSSTRLKNVKQKYDESFLNHSLNNASNAALMVDVASFQAPSESVAMSIN